MSVVVNTQGLRRRFGRSNVLAGLDLTIEQGSVYGLVGPNGAGKTTTVKVLMNIIRPTAGNAAVLGCDSRRLSPAEYRQIGYVSENQEMPEWMTVDYFMAYLKPFYPTWDDARARTLIDDFNLPRQHRCRRRRRTASRPRRPLLARLRGPYYVPEHQVRRAIADRASFNVIHLETMVKVDVFVSPDRPFGQRALDRAQLTPVEGGGTIPVSSAEDTVLAKLDWFRRGGEVSERQWTDVRGLLTAGGHLDADYLGRGARELGVADLLRRVLDEVGGRAETD